jgi:hypothetical protein
VRDWIQHFCEYEDRSSMLLMQLGWELGANEYEETQPLGASLMRRSGLLHVRMADVVSLEGADIVDSPVHMVMDLMRRTVIFFGGHTRDVFIMEDIWRTLVALRVPHRKLRDVEMVPLSAAHREEYGRRVCEARDGTFCDSSLRFRP